MPSYKLPTALTPLPAHYFNLAFKKFKIFFLFLFSSILFLQSCKKDASVFLENQQEKSKAEIININTFFAETKGSEKAELKGASVSDQLLTFRIDSTQIYKVVENNGTVTYSMRLIPSSGDSRRVFYNLYYKKDSLGKVAQMIIKYKPTSASIKSGYTFFEGEHEIISTEPISQGLIKSNSVNLKVKKNDVELMCVEIAFDRPCSNGYVHYENGPGPWCQVEGSYKFTLRDCWSGGSSSSMSSFGQSVNATAIGSSGTVFVTPNSLNSIVLCDSEEGDNFILSLYQTYLTWIQSSTSNLNMFNQIVGGVCGDLSNDNKVVILKKLKIVKEANISLQEYNNWFEGVAEGYDGESIDPNDLEYETPVTQEQLPSLNVWLTHFPKISNTVAMDVNAVFNLIGGDLLLAKITDPNNYGNACAIRGSRGLLYSGISIPKLKYGNPPKQATMKGSDNKNYILSALNFNKFMIDKFGDTPDKLIGSDANDPVKVANFLKGKSGIYVIVNAQSGNAGYTGHVDAIVNGRCISGAYTNPKGGVSSIRVWQLN